MPDPSLTHTRPSTRTAPTQSAHPTIPPALLTSHTPQRSALLQSLRLQHLLHARHKNQHRRAFWFRHFSRFRRETGLFCAEIGISLLGESGGEGNGRAIVAAKGEKLGVLGKRKRGVDGGSVKKDNRHGAAAEKRLAYWISADLIPKWYTALTTLTSTPSFTPLSLTLLALLARTLQQTGALTLFTSHTLRLRDAARAEEVAKEEEVRAREEEEIVGVLEAFARERGEVAVGGLEMDGLVGDEDVDEGVVVEREMLGGSLLQKRNKTPKAGSKNTSNTNTPLSTTITPPPPAYQTPPITTTSNSQNATPDTTPPGDPPQPNPSKPPAKKRKASKPKPKPTNAIDALFAGL